MYMHKVLQYEFWINKGFAEMHEWNGRKTAACNLNVGNKKKDDT